MPSAAFSRRRLIVVAACVCIAAALYSEVFILRFSEVGRTIKPANKSLKANTGVLKVPHRTATYPGVSPSPPTPPSTPHLGASESAQSAAVGRTATEHQPDGSAFPDEPSETPEDLFTEMAAAVAVQTPEHVTESSETEPQISDPEPSATIEAQPHGSAFPDGSESAIRELPEAADTQPSESIVPEPAAGGDFPDASEAGDPGEFPGESLGASVSPAQFYANSLVNEQKVRYEGRCRQLIDHVDGPPKYFDRYSDAGIQEHGLMVLDWSSRDKFNGIGNEMQHYMELVAMGMASGRAGFVETQRPDCEVDVMNMSIPADDPRLKPCIYDLADFFETTSGHSWNFNQVTRRRVQKLLGEDVKETVILWGTQGMYHGDTKLCDPEENLLKILLESDVFKTSKWIRIVVGQDFSRWCHPPDIAREHYGMCESYRWAIGIEGHRAPGPCPGCGGACFGYAMLQPSPLMRDRLQPYMRQLSRRGWQFTVGLHLRTGFSDLSSHPRPPLEEYPSVRPAVVRTADLEEFMGRHLARLAFPDPMCPVDLQAAPEGPREDFETPLLKFFECGEKIASFVAKQNRIEEKEGKWGFFLSTDSPTVKKLVLHDRQLSGTGGGTVSSNGTYGHVTVESATCDHYGANRAACAEVDRREAWIKSMIDLYILSLCDYLLLMFESSYTNAALQRSFSHNGRKVYYDKRFTHSFVDIVTDQVKNKNTHNEDTIRQFASLWDMIGPLGPDESD